MKKMLVLLAVTLLIPVTVSGDLPSVPPAPEAIQPFEAAVAAKPEIIVVTEVVVINTTYKASKLDESFGHVAKAMKVHLKGATFKVVENVLYVGVKYDILRPDVVLARIGFDSDCPDNSQYSVESSYLAALGQKQVREILISWTKYRHDAMDASVRVVNVANRGKRVNFDVQLNLKTVALR